MQNALSDILGELQAFGALQSQLVDVSNDHEPRMLSYMDLRAQSSGWRCPVVVEHSGQPCVHVFDGRDGVTDDQIALWCWRIALRGDGAWVGVLEPGKLRIYSVDILKNEIKPNNKINATPNNWALLELIHGVRAGQDDLPRRRYLLQLLERSANAAIRGGLSETDALSLVGRGLFWRFLVDRGLLKGLEPSDICSSAKTWKNCLDAKSRALETFQWLDNTFNGGLLPFDADPNNFNPTIFADILGNIAHGATETGQLRLPVEWAELDFSYIPVGLLSEVYEAFAHNLDKKEASKNSIHYTPAYLADFMVTQSLGQFLEGSKPRILDPAVGAGVFLVTAFRRLIEREWKEKGKRPARKRIREILNEQLVGFDIDARALRLTELALYLTALELDPKPKPLNELRFEKLRGKVLFDFSKKIGGSLDQVEDQFRGKFDLVIGNPPWTAISKASKEKKAWLTYSKAVAVERLGVDQVKDFGFPDNNIDLPFIWRAMEWGKPGGIIAMITHARWLFGISRRFITARNSILQAIRITGILNGSALRLSDVWPQVDAPWCITFAVNESPIPRERAAFQFISPSMETEAGSEQSRMRIDWLDSQIIPVEEAIRHPWALKSRFRGNRLALRTLETMHSKGISLGDYLVHLGTDFKNGYQVGVSGKMADTTHLLGMPDTKGAGSLGFVVDPKTLPIFNRGSVLFPRSLDIYKGPLLLVKESIPANPLTARASLINSDALYHESYHGISFFKVHDSDFVARYLQLYLQSSVMIFVELLIDGRYGVERDTIYKESLYCLPIIAAESLNTTQRSDVMSLANELADGLNDKLLFKIDQFIFSIFGLSEIEQSAIRDTLETALPSTASKRKALSHTSKLEREKFIQALKISLNNVLSASGKSANVKERTDLERGLWKFFEVHLADQETFPQINLSLNEFQTTAYENGASLVAIQLEESTYLIGMIDRYQLWTPTRGRILATEILSGAFRQ